LLRHPSESETAAIVEEKRRIVEETLEAVHRSARGAAACVNANQVFYWRKKYREDGWVGASPANSCL